jgi:hypothetical protein
LNLGRTLFRIDDDERVSFNTTGFLLEDTPEYKTIVGTKNASQVLGRITIQGSCIKKLKSYGRLISSYFFCLVAASMLSRRRSLRFLIFFASQ